MKSMTRASMLAVAALFAVSLFASESRAAESGLILTIDPTAKTYSLSGATTVSATLAEESVFAQWSIGSAAAPGSTTFPAIMATSSPVPLDATLLRLFDGYVDLIFDFGLTTETTFTITGNSAVLSYSGATAAQMSYFESLIGQSIPLVRGTGGAPIQVRGVAEPPTIEGLIRDVEALRDAGELKPGQANGLIQPLQNALRSLEQEKIDSACSQLADFIAEVALKVEDGALTPEQGQDLIDKAVIIRAQLGCD